VRVLLDTHAFLWFVTADSKLSDNARTLIADLGNEVLISPASYWEIAIKVSLGKYPLTVPFEAFFQRQYFPV
jgi:PIN domain nuclease of toxin-antitoxin system